MRDNQRQPLTITLKTKNSKHNHKSRQKKQGIKSMCLGATIRNIDTPAEYRDCRRGLDSLSTFFPASKGFRHRHQHHT